MATLSQKRALHAYTNVNDIATNPNYAAIRGKYGSAARELPSMIQINGLGQTLAFLRAKSKGEPTKAHMILYRHMEDWLNAHVLPGVEHATTDFLRWVCGQNSGVYHIATLEALEYSVWLKRCAEAAGLVSEETPAEEEE